MDSSTDSSHSQNLDNESLFEQWHRHFMAKNGQISDAFKTNSIQAGDALKALDTFLKGLGKKREMLSRMESHIHSLKEKINGTIVAMVPLSGLPGERSAVDAGQAGKVEQALIQIFVDSLTGKTVVIHIESSGRVADLKEAISLKEGTPRALQRLYFGGNFLADNFEINTLSGSTVQLGIALLGGMPNERREDEDLPQISADDAALIAQTVSEPNSEDNLEEADAPEDPVEEAEADIHDILLQQMRTSLESVRDFKNILEDTKEFRIKQYGSLINQSKRESERFQKKLQSCDKKMDRCQLELADKTKRLNKAFALKKSQFEEDLTHENERAASERKRLEKKKISLQESLQRVEQEENDLQVLCQECVTACDDKIAKMEQRAGKIRLRIVEMGGVLSPDASDSEDASESPDLED